MDRIDTFLSGLVLGILMIGFIAATLLPAGSAEYNRCMRFFKNTLYGFDSAPEVCEHIVFGSDYSLEYPNE